MSIEIGTVDIHREAPEDAALLETACPHVNEALSHIHGAPVSFTPGTLRPMFAASGMPTWIGAPRRGEPGVAVLSQDTGQQAGLLTVLLAADDALVLAALVEWARAVATSAGASVLVAMTFSDGGEQGEPARVVQDEVMAAAGGSVAQVVECSRLELPVAGEVMAELEQLERDEEYTVERRIGPIPEEWLEGLAMLNNRMMVEAPSGDIPYEEGRGTAEELRERSRAVAEAGGVQVRAVALHAGTGQMVGFTALGVAPAAPTVAEQGSTLVLPEHRGHRLGLRLKLANLAQLQRELPEVVAVSTGSATENRWMLGSNEHLGFRPGPQQRTFLVPLGT